MKMKDKCGEYNVRFGVKCQRIHGHLGSHVYITKKTGLESKVEWGV